MCARKAPLWHRSVQRCRGILFVAVRDVHPHAGSSHHYSFSSLPPSYVAWWATVHQVQHTTRVGITISLQPWPWRAPASAARFQPTRALSRLVERGHAACQRYEMACGADWCGICGEGQVRRNRRNGPGAPKANGLPKRSGVGSADSSCSARHRRATGKSPFRPALLRAWPACSS